MIKEIKHYSKLPAQLEKVQNFILNDECDYNNLEVSNQVFLTKNITYLDIDDCYFKRCDFGKIKGTNIKINNTLIEDSDLSNSNLDRILIDSVDFVSCKMTGFIATNSSIRNVTFSNCKLNLSQFRFSHLKNVIFYNCILEEADLYNADLFNVVFKECSLIRAEMSKTKLFETDFRTSNISGMNISIESLKGAIISNIQLVDLSWLLGAKIK